MDTQTIVVSIIVLAVSLIILYFLIEGAVKSGTKDIKEMIRMQNRYLSKMLNEQGTSAKEILEIPHYKPEDFYKTLKQ